MSEKSQGSGSMDTSERMATLAEAMADAIQHKAKGEHETEDGARSTMDLSIVETLIERWPDAPKMTYCVSVDH